MASLNKVMLIGNLTRDPELKKLESGKDVCTFGIATNRSWKNQNGEKQEAVEFHNIVTWGKLAEICGQYLHKGKQVFIEGRLQTRDYEKDGVRHYRTEIVGDNMVMLGSKGEGGASSAPRSSTPSSAPAGDEVRIEDIPF